MSTAGSHNVQLQSETTGGEGMEAIPPTPQRRGKSLSVPRSISGFGEMCRFRKLPKKNAPNM